MTPYSEQEQFDALTHAFERMDYYCVNDDKYRHHVLVITQMLKDLDTNIAKRKDNRP